MPPPEDHEGLKQELSTLAKDAGKFLQTRGELLAIEAQEASLVYQKRAKSYLLLTTFITTAYLLIILSLTGFLGYFLSQHGDGPFFSWMGAALILALIHFFFAIICFLKARQSPQEPLFEYTRREWTKDQSWIKQDIAKKS